METKLAIALALASFGGEPAAETPVVQADLCRCGLACPCAEATQTPVVVKTVAIQKQVAPPATRTVLDHGYSTTHTHACPNQDCPFNKYWGEPYVWGGKDHAHVCPYCKSTQTVLSNKPITLVREVPVATPAKTASPAQQVITLATLQTSGLSSSACASGQCPTVGMPARRGFLSGRWR